MEYVIEQENAFGKPYTIGVSVVGAALFVYALVLVLGAPLDTTWLLLCAVTLLAVSRIRFRIPGKTGKVALSSAFYFISFFLYGLMPSVVLAGMDAAVSSMIEKERRKLTLFDLSVGSLSIFFSGGLVSLLLQDPPYLKADVAMLVVAAGILGLGYSATNSVLVSVGAEFAGAWKESFLWSSAPGLVGVVTACLVVKLIDAVSFYAFIVAVPVLAIAYMTYRVYLDKVETAIHHAEEMAAVHLRTIEALAIAIDVKDEVTHDHVERVRVYAVGLARLFGLSETEVEALRAGALLHDIGKLAVPDYILNKPGALTPAEFDKMKLHTVVGAEILEKVAFPHPVVPIVRYHHERWDGRGYPDGLMGDQIPITARIMALADTFDAVQEERQYRKAMMREEAIKFIREGSGSLFDPELTRTFLEHLSDFEAEIRHRGVGREMARLQRERNPSMRERLLESRESVFERIRVAHREVLTLYRVAEAIRGNLDLRDAFAIFASRLDDIVSHTTCVLYLFRPETTELEATHVNGHNSEWFKGRRMASGEGITGWVVAHRHPMHNCDPKLDFAAMKVDVREQYKNGIVVPLLKEKEVLGALALYNVDPRTYEPDHLRLVEAVAKLISDAISSLADQPRSMTASLGDQLTGLPNARALRYRFEEQVERGIRHRDCFSLAMLDIDGLRNVNERLGHQAGDDLLIEVARVLNTQVRPTDFVCRYGADEFVCIFQVSPEETAEFVSRIQLAVERHDFAIRASSLFTGVSAGWAAYGVDGNSLDELLVAADRAMHADKAKRRALPAEMGSLRSGGLGRLNVV